MNKKGAVSIFLLIVFTSVMVLLLILFDMSRIRGGHVFVKRAVNDSALALLSHYDSKIKTGYGIFGFGEDTEYALNFFNNALETNLNIPGPGLYDFQIEDVKVTFMDDLGNPARVKEQILEYMKYRMPREVLLNIFEKVKQVKNAGNQTIYISEKLILDTMMYELDRIKLRIINQWTNLSGKFNKDGIRDLLINEFVGLLERSLEEEIPWEEIDAVFERLYFNETADFLNANLELISSAQNLMDVIQSVKAKGEEIISLLKAGGFPREFIDEVEHVLEDIPDLGGLEQLIKEIQGNVSLLQDSLGIILDIKDNFHRYTVVSAVRMLTDANINYRSPDFNIKMEIPPGQGSDIRGNALLKVKEFFQSLFDSVEKNIDFTLLPSGTFKEGDYDINPVEDVNFDLENKGFIKKAMEYFKNLGEGVKLDLEGLTEDIRVSFYILDRFEHITSRDLLKYTDEKFANAMVGEVEYILHGMGNERLNLIKTLMGILLMRFGINVLEAYKDPVKVKNAYLIACSISGLMLNGAAIPILKNLILCSYGMIDSVMDLEKLHQGKVVPLMSNCPLKLNYEDYLLILLVFKSMDSKILRIMDLIQINITKDEPGFILKERCCQLRCEVTVSMKMVFLPGRKYITVVLDRGY